MANSSQATKRARQNIKREKHNASQRSAARTAIKKTLKLIASGDKEGAKTAFGTAKSLLDRIARRGIFNKNKVARIKSRLNNRLRG